MEISQFTGHFRSRPNHIATVRDAGPGGAARRIGDRMRPVTVSRMIDTPRERVFAYLSDIANHAEFSDHYLSDFRLERLDSTGLGAAARWRMDFPLARVWGDATITEFDPPHLIVLEGSSGRLGRIKTRAEYRLVPAGNDMTRVEYRFESESSNPVDRLKEALGMRGWLRRKARTGLARMARVLEEGVPSAQAVRPAAG
jgi:uncharacterized protein YndB with AHSA1/START domain